ncbi:MAG: ABC transporter ATP-binding protein [Dehalococcoidia bacterium]|nr:ABC transporter ATP-binding protein [Dehalococcoidia bacterium]
MHATGVAEMRDMPLETLSGGQRQRAWLAMALAQDTPTLLLDEPTTFLDIAHQVEVLDLVHRMNREEGRTIVMVLHDLGHAAHYADHLVAMRDGQIGERAPDDVFSEELVEHVFGVSCNVHRAPLSGAPIVVPSGNQVRIDAPAEMPEPSMRS